MLWVFLSKILVLIFFDEGASGAKQNRFFSSLFKKIIELFKVKFEVRVKVSNRWLASQKSIINHYLKIRDSCHKIYLESFQKSQLRKTNLVKSFIFFLIITLVDKTKLSEIIKLSNFFIKLVFGNK